MQASRRGTGPGAAVVALLALFIAAPAVAQENIDAGKSPAELYRQDCAICHKSPYGLAKAGGSGLESYLRVHYTASRESAAAIARYLVALDRKAAHEHARQGARHHRAKADKLPPRRPAAGKGDAKAGAKQAGKPEAKPANKPVEAEAAPKPKSGSAKTDGTKTDTAKPASATSVKAQAKPAKKPEKK
ncbi:MAG: hypothetical protein P8Y53_16740, partial [Pseudolabrys sp.]